MRSDKDNLIVNLTFDFAIEIIKCSKILQQSHDYALFRRFAHNGFTHNPNSVYNKNHIQDYFIFKIKLMYFRIFSNYQIFKSSNQHVR